MQQCKKAQVPFKKYGIYKNVRYIELPNTTMNDFEYRTPGHWIGTIASVAIALIVISVICLNDGCREKLHYIYNLIPPQKARLTIFLKNRSGEQLSNQPLIFDDKDSLITDNEGGIVIDGLPMGRHWYSIMYGDSLHLYPVNLKKDSSIIVTLRMQGKDIVEGKQPANIQQIAGIDLKKGKVLTYNQQWFTVGKSVKFGQVCVKLVKIEDRANTVYVNICRTTDNFICQTSITENTKLSRDNWIRFADNGYDYTLTLDRLDGTTQDTKNIAAFVSMVQTVR